MNQTLRHHLPLLAAGQAQKEVTHNEALAGIDARLQLSVLSRQLAAPPAAPNVGDGYIVHPDASGAWAGAEDQIAFYDGYGWLLTAPIAGTIAWIADEAGCVVWDGSWSTGWPVASLRVGARNVLAAAPVALAVPSGGMTVDEEARAAIVAIQIALREQGLIY